MRLRVTQSNIKDTARRLCKIMGGKEVTIQFGNSSYNIATHVTFVFADGKRESLEIPGTKGEVQARLLTAYKVAEIMYSRTLEPVEVHPMIVMNDWSNHEYDSRGGK